MDLMDIATELFINKVTKKDAAPDSLNSGIVKMALQALLGGEDGSFDLGDLVSKFDTGDLVDLASSWLGDGDNSSISATQIIDVLGKGQVSDFASKIGIGTEVASEGLSETIPELIDKSSEGGSLLDAVGGVDGAFDLAKKFF